jgi:hypothetical protein
MKHWKLRPVGHSKRKARYADIRCTSIRACPHTAACTRALLEHFNWELFDHLPHSLNLAPSYYHLFTYLKNWLGSQHFNNNGKLMEDIKTWLSSQTFLTHEYKNVFPDTSASIPAVTTLRSSLRMKILFVHKYKYFLVACFINSSLEIFYLNIGGWSPYWVHSALRPLLACCTCPGWLWGWRSWWNERFWQGKPNYSEKTCPDATLSITIPTCQTRDWFGVG